MYTNWLTQFSKGTMKSVHFVDKRPHSSVGVISSTATWIADEKLVQSMIELLCGAKGRRGLIVMVTGVGVGKSAFISQLLFYSKISTTCISIVFNVDTYAIQRFDPIDCIISKMRELCWIEGTPVPTGMAGLEQARKMKRKPVIKLLALVHELALSLGKRIIIAFDDCHLMKFLHWWAIFDLCNELQDKMHSDVVFVIGSRPLDIPIHAVRYSKYIPKFYKNILDMKGTVNLIVKPLTRTQTTMLVMDEILRSQMRGIDCLPGVVTVAGEFMNPLYIRTSGVPFFVKETLKEHLPTLAALDNTSTIDSRREIAIRWMIPHEVERVLNSFLAD